MVFLFEWYTGILTERSEATEYIYFWDNYVIFYFTRDADRDWDSRVRV